MFRLAVWLAATRFLFWNVGTPEPGEWMPWCGDWLKCCGRYHASASWDRDGFTFTLADDADPEYEPPAWEETIRRLEATAGVSARVGAPLDEARAVSAAPFSLAIKRGIFNGKPKSKNLAESCAAGRIDIQSRFRFG